jgi:co-chaperonin GroES (HSP10)
MKTNKTLIMVGEKVLIRPDEDAEQSAAGLYLPPTVREKERVQGGYVVKTGPGYPIADPSASEEPWMERKFKYIPLEATEGDYAIFLRSEAIEIEFEDEKYLIVPHSAILALVRTELLD